MPDNFPTTSDFTAQFPEMYRAAYAAAYRISGSSEVAEDAASEAIYRAGIRWKHVSNYSVPWVIRVATNLVIDERRRARRAMPFSRAADLVAHDTEPDLDLLAALRRLPRGQREVIILRYLGTCTTVETAAALGIAVGTVKSQTSRAVTTLRSLLAPASVSEGSND